MKKMIAFMIPLLLVLNLFPQEEGEKEKKHKTKLIVQDSIMTKDVYEVITDQDIHCSYYIGPRRKKEMYITSSSKQDLNTTVHSDGDQVIINKGMRDGIRDGDTLQVIEVGKKIYNPITLGKLGTYYKKKSLATVTCAYDETAIITLTRTCHPVEIGDLVIPYVKENTVSKQKPIYSRCKLPESSVHGNVVFLDITLHMQKFTAGDGDIVIIDIGKSMISRGDFVLFYKQLKRKLPPIITGTGIVINSQNTNSSVKILRSSFPVEVGHHVVHLPEEALDKPEDRQYDLPIIQTLKKETKEVPQAREGEESFELNIYFDIDKKVFDPKYKTEMEKIKTFIETKSEFVVVLRGFSCSIGNEEYNLKLSQARVENIKDYLVKNLGIAENFIETYFYGEKDSPFDNTSEEERRKNRLVQINVIGK